jgi:hypothetical protein
MAKRESDTKRTKESKIPASGGGDEMKMIIIIIAGDAAGDGNAFALALVT